METGLRVTSRRLEPPSTSQRLSADHLFPQLLFKGSVLSFSPRVMPLTRSHLSVELRIGHLKLELFNNKYTDSPPSHVPSTVLSTRQVLTHLMLTTDPQARCYGYYPRVLRGKVRHAEGENLA